MILDAIEEKLKEVDPCVFYGVAENIDSESLWNYIVFDRKLVKLNENKTSFIYRYRVHIVREVWVPEGIEEEVIKKMLEIKGMKLATNDMQYTRTTKGNTGAVVEALTIEFSRSVIRKVA